MTLEEIFKNEYYATVSFTATQAALVADALHKYNVLGAPLAGAILGCEGKLDVLYSEFVAVREAAEIALVFAREAHAVGPIRSMKTLVKQLERLEAEKNA